VENNLLLSYTILSLFFFGRSYTMSYFSFLGGRHHKSKEPTSHDNKAVSFPITLKKKEQEKKRKEKAISWSLLSPLNSQINNCVSGDLDWT
jgi:hypothetical protein